MTDKQACACNVKKFNADKLSKKTRKEVKPKPIKQASKKKLKERKERGSLLKFYQVVAKNHFNEHGDGACMYCNKIFNIETDFVDNRVAFAHILAKGDPLYKHLAVFKNNIAIVCSESCHKEMDAEICKLGLKNILKDRIEKLEKIKVNDLISYL